MVDQTFPQMPLISDVRGARPAAREALLAMTSTDILLPEASAAGVSRARVAVFLPIALAVAGVAIILMGGVSARGPATETAATSGIDPIITGSIMTPDDRRQALIMLDR